MILIDTPGSLGLLTLSAIVAADRLIVPAMTVYQTTSLQIIRGTVGTIRRNYNPDLAIAGVLALNCSKRARVEEDIRTSLGSDDLLLNTCIHRSARCREAASQGKTIFEMPRAAQQANEYCKLVAELVGALAPSRNQFLSCNNSLQSSPPYHRSTNGGLNFNSVEAAENSVIGR